METKIEDVVRRFGLKPNKVTPLRAAYLVESMDGYYCIKKLNYKEDKLLFIYGAKKHLVNNGFSNIDTYLVPRKKPFVSYKNELFIMTKYILGRECDFSNPIEIHEASKNLARFHMASKGYIAPEGSREKSDLGKWTRTYLKRCEDLIYIKNLVSMKSTKDTVDILFLRNVDIYYKMAMAAVGMLEGHGYFEQVEEEREKRFLCHHDYTYHNILIDHEDIQHIIDFDYCKYELRCFDIAQFIMRNMTRFHWDFPMAIKLLESYNQVRPISPRELKLMASLFQFPQRFWRVATRYYFEKYDWSQDTFIDQLSKIIDDRPFLMEFLGKYYKEYL